MHDCFRDQGLPVTIVFATASRLDVPVAALCRELGIDCRILPPRREGFEARLLELCRNEKIDLIALAGFMSLLSAEFLDAVAIPVLNIHPALLPRYGGPGMYGLKVHEAVWASGDKVSGASVHRVDPLYDHGELIAQEKVDISDCHGPQEIAARVLAVEHRLYGPAIHRFLSGSDL